MFTNHTILVVSKEKGRVSNSLWLRISHECYQGATACDTPQVFRDPMKPLLEGRDTTEELMEGRTTFVILHHPSTLRHCNVQLKVKEGRMA
jgi:hypothetical protein